MCSPFIRKEANRFFWIIKGQLIPRSWSDKEVEGIYDSYMKRMWGNHENVVHEVGFSQAWSLREAEVLDDELDKVAVLGYN
mgnify:FL=1